ncbi:MAG: sugar phosphate isomerase/epimerase [Thermomicrobiales bacterium]|nr:sugar phosphate isomerase/epimerase [Thermomicrobiales bacterium]
MYNLLIPGCIGIHDINLADSIKLAREAGFEGVSFDIFEAQEYADANGVDALKELFGEIIPGVWNHGVDWQNDEKRDAQIERLKGVLDLANELDSLNVTTGIMPANNDRPYDEQYEFLSTRLKPLADALAEGNVRIGIEFITPKTLRDKFTYQFIYKMTDMLDFAKHVGGNVGVLFDVWHHYCAHGTVADLDVLTPQDVQLIHTNDAPLGLEIDEQQDLSRTLPLETSVIPAVEMLRKLADIGVDVGVAAEPFSAALNEIAASDPLQAAKITQAANEKLFVATGLRG